MQVGRLVVLGPLGEGGTAVVYLAYDRELDRKVALKFMRSSVTAPEGATTGTRSRIMREAQALARLSHPNVVTIHDVGTHDDQVFIAEAFVDGWTATDWLKVQRRAWRETLEVFLQAGRGIAAAHAAGLIHRDFKPGNVLIGKDGRVQVTDFGLARATHESDSDNETADLLQPIDALELKNAAVESAGSPRNEQAGSGGGKQAAAGDAVERAAGGGATDQEADRHLTGSAACHAIGSVTGNHIGSDQSSKAAGSAASSSTVGGASISSTIDRASLLATPLTRTGTLMGTPAYMAPEQHLGRRTDARTDQFNYCVALYEVLYGERPFAGRTISELATEVSTGRIKPPPKNSRVPYWIRKAILRGLRPSPVERFPSMEALLAALSRDPIARLRTIAIWTGIVMLVAAVGLGASWYEQRKNRVCQGAESKLAGVWDGRRKEEVRRAFLATDKPFAQASWQAVARIVDSYTREWVAMHEDACKATRIRGEQSEHLLDLRIGCLSQRLGELNALVDLLAAADSSVVQHSIDAVSRLSGVEACADLEGMKAVIPPPKDQGTGQRVAAERDRLAKAKALGEMGQYDQGLALAVLVRAEAEKVGYRPLVAEAQLRVGSLRLDAGDYQGAEDSLKDALFAAVESKHREIEVQAAIALAHVLGYRQKRADLGHFWARYAKAALVAHGPDEILEAAWHRAIASVYNVEANYDKQLEHNERALALRIRTVGSEQNALVAGDLNNLGVTYANQGDYSRALEYFQRNLELTEKLFGPSHPNNALVISNLALTFEKLEDRAKEKEYAEKALAIHQQAMDPQHPFVARAHRVVGQSLHNRGEHNEALLHYRQALAISEKAVAADHPDVAGALEGIATELGCLGGKTDEAAEHAKRAIKLMESVLGRRHPDLADYLATLGEIYLGGERPNSAIEPLERALLLPSSSGIGYDERSLVRFYLARALWDTGQDRNRAIELAGKARDGLKQAGIRPSKLRQVESWLSTHKVAP
ncbi:MAG: serine/threonine-protein kinase [Pseudomonadota bacterium]